MDANASRKGSENSAKKPRLFLGGSQISDYMDFLRERDSAAAIRQKILNEE
jgi:hypothetical protein